MRPKKLVSGPQPVQTKQVKLSVDLDEDLAAEVDRTAELVKENPATVLKLAIKAGLPSVIDRFQAPRPEGYFAKDYPLPDEVLKLEEAMAKLNIGPDK